MSDYAKEGDKQRKARVCGREPSEDLPQGVPLAGGAIRWLPSALRGLREAAPFLTLLACPPFCSQPQLVGAGDLS